MLKSKSFHDLTVVLLNVVSFTHGDLTVKKCKVSKALNHYPNDKTRV